MIKIENIKVTGWEAAIRGMRNPMNSWDKSDSHFCEEDCPHVINDTEPAKECDNGAYGFCIGTNDLALMKKLASAGSDHRKFMRMIVVTADITAPLYWWKEYDTYKVGTVANSCSTMHKIHERDLTLDDFSHEHLDDKAMFRLAVDGKYDEDDLIVTPESMLEIIVSLLNCYRENYLETQDKSWWYKMIQFLPTSYNQKRTIMLNYENLVNMYKAREHHKLDEWRQFCEQMKELPYFVELL